MRNSHERGVTLLDTVVGTALMLLIFLGIYAAFQLSVDVVSTNKARAGAIALVDERMEYLRSLPYGSLGTVGGIPPGSIVQNENVTLNGISYNRRTLIEYYDDSKDGSGGGDSNGIDADSKIAKVDVSWTSRFGTRDIVAVTRIAPTTGLESTVSGGTLLINAVTSTGAALAGAQVSVVNASSSVNLTTFTNASGTVELIGSPAGSGYQIVVSKSGYSTAQTYTASAQNTSPDPGNLTVSNSVTTSSTFAIDLLGSKTIITYSPVQAGSTTALFTDSSAIATSTNVSISGSAARISGTAPYGSGEFQTTPFAPAYLTNWKSVSWSASTPTGTSVIYRVYDAAGANLIPDSQIPGNAAGFTSPPIDLSGVSTSTYTGIRVDAILSGASSTPSVSQINIGYLYGPVPLPNVPFTLTGAKTIGTGPSGTVHKYAQSLSSGSNASVTVPNLEWDAYTIAMPAGTSYDISSACNPQPEGLSPGATMTSTIYLLPHTSNSLLVDVRSAASGALLTGAIVTLTRTGFSGTGTTDGCGQAFFGGLTATTYSISVSLAGYTTYTAANAISVSGATRYSVTL